MENTRVKAIIDPECSAPDQLHIAVEAKAVEVLLLRWRLMAQSCGEGARGVVTGVRLVITVEVVCEMLVVAAGVMSGLPDVTVAVTLETTGLGEEQLINSSAVRMQAQLAEKRGDPPAR